MPYPAHVNLGKNCRAMTYRLPIRKSRVLRSVTLETMSQEVVIGLMGISVTGDY
jgi:hypothetical protein